MTNFSIGSSGGPERPNIRIRELKPEVSLEQALAKTASNGLDEAFVEAGGKRYVLYSDDDIVLANAEIQVEGKAATLLSFNDEINSFGEGLCYLPGKGLKAAWSVIKPIGHVVPNLPTGMAIATGVLAGAAARHAFTPYLARGGYDPSQFGQILLMTGTLTGAVPGAALGLAAEEDSFGRPTDKSYRGALIGGGVGAALGGGIGAALSHQLHESPLSRSGAIGLGFGAMAGVAAVTAAADHSQASPEAKQLRAWATGAGSVAAGALTPEALRLASHIHIPDGAIAGAKIAGTALLVGGGLASLGLATAGAIKQANYAGLDEITQNPDQK